MCSSDLSKTLQHADWNTTIVRDVDPDEVRELKERSDGDLMLGGADLGATFLKLGLIDGFRLYIHPVVLGRGNPLFRPSDVRVDLDLVETRRFGNGVVLLRYARG